MDGWADVLPPGPDTRDLALRVDADPNVLGVVLTGSHAHGLATPESDVDLHLVVRRSGDDWAPPEGGRIDLVVSDLRRFSRRPADPSRWWDRYTLARGRLLLDRSGGDVRRALAGWAILSADEQCLALDYYLDPYLNYAYRSLREHRDGNARAAHLDAMEALPWTLRLAFALHRRVRPTNKYLVWEIEHHPFLDPAWDGDWFLGAVDRVTTDGDAGAQREFFAAVEPGLRRLGFGGALDGYPEAVRLLTA